MRAFACLMVIWYHINIVPFDFHIWNLQSSIPPLFAAFLYFGQFGVTLFFVLSGFLLFMPYVKSLLFAETWPSARRFYLRRVFRILPAYYLTLILLVLFYQRQYLQPQHLQDLALFFTLFMDSSHATYKQLNAPFWTLAIEWQYYMLLPLLMLGMRLVVQRFKQNYRLPATFGCIILLIAWGVFTRFVGIYFMVQHPARTFLVPLNILHGILFFTWGVSGKYFEAFGTGMLLSLCFVYTQHPSISPGIRTILHRLSPWLWGTGVLSLFAMILWNYNERYPMWPLFSNPFLFTYYYQLNVLGFALSFGLFILALLYGSIWIKWPFEWMPVRWLGSISYSMYMWHFPLLIVFIKWCQPFLNVWPLALNYSAYWLWVILVIIPFCFLFFILIEKPGIKLGERLNRQSRKANVAPNTVKSSPAVNKIPATKAAP